MAWLEGKSHNIGVVYITGTRITAGGVSKRFQGHADQAESDSTRTTETSSMSTSFGRLNVIQKPSLSMLTAGSCRGNSVAIR